MGHDQLDPFATLNLEYFALKLFNSQFLFLLPFPAQLRKIKTVFSPTITKLYNAA